MSCASFERSYQWFLIAEDVKGVTVCLHSDRSFRINLISLHIEQIGLIFIGPIVAEKISVRNCSYWPNGTSYKKTEKPGQTLKPMM